MKNLNALLIATILATLSVANAKVRADKGQPIVQDERERATDEYIALLKDTRYFDYIDSRAHGQPEDGNPQTFWYGHMWTGVVVKKENGVVSYTHRNNGSDNVGIHSAPYLEGACYAYLITGDKRYSHLARKLIRGFSSWILSSARDLNDTPKILSRSFYPASYSSNDGGRSLVVNYEASRPGIHTDAADYVHIPNNPTFGDLWVKNNRSIDDIGQMIRSMVQVQACKDVFDEETKTDLEQMNKLYANWAKSVDDNNFVIPTFNLSAQIINPKKSMGDFNLYDYLAFNPNCSGKYAVRLLHSDSPGNMRCGDGISAMEILIGKKTRNDAVEILRYQHISALALSRVKNLSDETAKFSKGLIRRMERDFDAVKNPGEYKDFDIQDIPTYYIHANNVGATMTSEQMRFVYDRIHMAYVGMRAPEYYNTFHLFDADVPDGDYKYDPPNIGLYYYTLGPILGACVSPLRNKGERQLLNCEKLFAAFK